MKSLIIAFMLGCGLCSEKAKVDKKTEMPLYDYYDDEAHISDHKSKHKKDEVIKQKKVK